MVLTVFVLSLDDDFNVAELFRRYYSQMHGIALKYLTWEEAEEAVQDSFIKIMEKAELLRAVPPEKRPAYCMVIVRNHAVNLVTGRKNDQAIEDVAYKLSDDTDIEADFVLHEDIGRLVTAMKMLSPDDYDILYLHYKHEMMYKDIALIKSLPEETIRKRGQRALVKLRNLMEKECQVL